VRDAATLTRLLAASFGSPEEAEREQVSRGLAESKRRYFLAVVDGNPVGLLFAGEWEEGSAGISAFGVLPAYRGRGIGRQMLLDAVDTLLDEGWKHVLIEVVTDNERALALYRSCGFRVTTAYGFYDLMA
jgi:ribosomal protein S18 acetylase RimI-like enzyme